MSEMEVTRVEVPYVNAGWRAGQHVRLRVLSFSLGWWAWTEVHPFTIASVSGSEEGMVLMCKRAGDWTRKLYDFAKSGGYTHGGGRQVKVMLEGPYGGFELITFFSSALTIRYFRGSWSDNFCQFLSGGICRRGKWHHICALSYPRFNTQ